MDKRKIRDIFPEFILGEKMMSLLSMQAIPKNNLLGLIGLIFVVIIFIVLAVIIYKKTVGSQGINWGKSHDWKQQSKSDEYFAEIYASKKSLEVIDTYIQEDVNFDKAWLCNQVEDMYIRMQRAWTKKDLSPLKPYWKESLYDYHDSRLKMIAESGYTNYFDDFRILSVEAMGWRREITPEGEVDLITIRIKSCAKDYILNDKTGELVNGSKTIVKKSVSEWVLRRSRGMTSLELSEPVCPSCHAVAERGMDKCGNCGENIILDLNGWLVQEIRTDNI
ncbi:MAG: TIM44-like domain-containing protein [Acutalibacteraceae bacterium]